jgi:hypothetical protein
MEGGWWVNFTMCDGNRHTQRVECVQGRVVRRMIKALRLALVVMILTSLTSCLPVADDQDAREQVVDLARSDKLVRAEGFDVFVVPDGLDHASRDGQVIVLRDGADLTVVFFDVRGLNHYTGWVYTSLDALPLDPLGNDPFQATRLGPHWYRVDAG